MIWFFICCFVVPPAFAVDGCGFPGSPSHGSIITTDETFADGTNVTFECDAGYQLIGRPVRRCVNTEWDSMGLPFCVREIAYLKPSQMSSNNLSAGLLVDGKSDTCAPTETSKRHAWIIDLLEETTVQIVEINFGSASPDLSLSISVQSSTTGRSSPCISPRKVDVNKNGSRYFKCIDSSFGRELLIVATGSVDFSISICEIKVYSHHSLSAQDACGVGSDNKAIGSYRNRCYELTPTELSFENAQNYCKTTGGSLWDGSDSEIISHMMHTHKFESVWAEKLRKPNNGTPEHCVAFSKDDQGLLGKQQIACMEAISGVCVRDPNSCGSPEIPRRITTWKDQKPLAIGESISLEVCETGFYVSGPESLRCESDGSFTKYTDRTVCRRSMCGQPPTVPNAYVVIDNEAEYVCVNDSFTSHGNATIKCDALTGHWGVPHLLCYRSPSINGVITKTFRERLLQGIELFPTGVRVGFVLLAITLVILAVLALIALVNGCKYFYVQKPKILRKANSSAILSTIQNELGIHMEDLQNNNNLAVPVSYELDLSAGDANVVTRTLTNHSTPTAIRTPKLRLNESSIDETNLE